MTTSLAAAGVLLMSACGQQTAGTTTSPSTPARTVSSPSGTPLASQPSSDSSGPANQQRLDVAANEIDRLSASYADTYTGLVVDSPGDRVIVYRTKDPSFDAAITRLHSGVRTELRDAPQSKKAMQVTRSALETLMGHTKGYKIWSVGAGSENSYAKGVVEVGVTGNLEQAKHELGAKFGDHVDVRAEEPPSAG
ncbi:hypothetical protein QMK19_34105 [Streptomyces sp. H10-C2]|uniref:hypothetical protein n=1 Tax=unclassified Streptomyces TaxID=2593676 RepID=UPI0024B9CC90|nr:MULTISPECIES: hypothetical protein [unclassified Streptomyces]MDJ0345673.1 hypothetical protein [Streptomyces sp. PH10-H1]MDJ0374525.1 hypothetical protein [Streptomyces sp. H10-C2]